jgi:putative ABC transport system substrate-binding protein
VQRLRELGWIEGRTVSIEYRWAKGRTERFDEIAAEFVRCKVDVIVTDLRSPYEWSWGWSWRDREKF